jgi:hypothetical protein
MLTYLWDNRMYEGFLSYAFKYAYFNCLFCVLHTSGNEYWPVGAEINLHFAFPFWRYAAQYTFAMICMLKLFVCLQT